MQITGKISIFGVAGDVTFTGVGVIQPANMETQNLGFKQTTKTVDLMNGQGEVVSRAYYGSELRINFTFAVKDSADPGVLADLKTSIKLIEPGSKATIANATLPLFNGDWNFAGDADIQPVQAGWFKYTCTLERVGKPASGTAAAAFLDDTP